MSTDFLKEIFQKSLGDEAFIWKGESYHYRWVLERVEAYSDELSALGITSGTVVALQGEASPELVSCLLALIEMKTATVMVPALSGDQTSKVTDLVQAEFLCSSANSASLKVARIGQRSEHALYQRLRELEAAGLVLLSSGTTGVRKAAVHNLEPFLQTYRKPRKRLRRVLFFPIDHLAGVHTLFSSLSNGSTCILVDDRKPDSVCALIETWRAEVLPTSPSFLNLILLSQAYKSHDLSSLKFITYGSEVMPETTLHRCREIFPQVVFLQDFGASEIAMLRSESKGSDSTWMKLGGDGVETRIEAGVLQIRAKSAMLGYLNADLNPFTEDGWFVTGDLVERSGEYIQIVGREVEIINVAGDKVNPLEVERCLQDVQNVKEVLVYGEPNPILGNIVCADVSLLESEDSDLVIRRLRAVATQNLPRYMVPVRINVVDKDLHSHRFKKIGRRSS